MRGRIHALTFTVASLFWIGALACASEAPLPSPPAAGATSPASTAASAEPFILRAGEGEALLNGLVVKASPEVGTRGSILVEQTFPLGGTTNLHVHDQGDELFYVVAGRGAATLGERTVPIEPGDAIFVPQGAVHRIENVEHSEPLTVVFFMDSPELVQQFRAMHERATSEPDRPITQEEREAIAERTGGSRRVE
jgi:mannose-6-phosphate isomerase-like protein (cupin superfamily)